RGRRRRWRPHRQPERQTLRLLIVVFRSGRLPWRARKEERRICQPPRAAPREQLVAEPFLGAAAQGWEAGLHGHSARAERISIRLPDVPPVTQSWKFVVPPSGGKRSS